MPISPTEIERAAEILRGGGLVAIPTETVYGLAADALNEAAVRRIFEVKQRPLTSPLIVHVADVAQAQALVSEWPALAGTLARTFWPGPLTIILPKTRQVPDLVTAGLPSVAIRMPAHPVALEVLRRTGRPLAAPSANRFTQISPTTAKHVCDGLGSSVDLVLDGGPCTIGIESTVVSLAGEEPVILRPGLISALDLEHATGLQWPVLNVKASESTAQPSPGLHARHYAPRTPLFLLKPNDPMPPGRGARLDLPPEPRAFAEALYAKLHEADKAGLDWLAILEPPDGPEWAGIRDRLKRASTSS